MPIKLHQSRVSNPHPDSRAYLPIPKAPTKPPPIIEGIVDQKGQPIDLDPYQLEAFKLFASGKSFVIIGKAGTGKTTLSQALGLHYILSNDLTLLDNQTVYRIKGQNEFIPAPKLAACAFTNRATNNYRNKVCSNPIVQKWFGYNITTIHNLLQYSVEFYIDPETGKNKRRYYPKKDKFNKLDIDIVIVEEGTLLGVGPGSLWEQLFEALPLGVQLVFLGDINQLPPVIGKSILNYALQQLPVIELKQVHRQALESGIIRQALGVIQGKIPVEDYDKELDDGVRIFSGKNKVRMTVPAYEHKFTVLVMKLMAAGQYDPMTDIILCPFNKLNKDKQGNSKAVSADNLSRKLATELARKVNATVWEIIAGYQKYYLRVGDRVNLDKQEGIVTEIRHNPTYYGKIPQQESSYLDYSGVYTSKGNPESIEEFDFSHFSVQDPTEEEEETEIRKRAISHIITVDIENPTTGIMESQTLATVGDLVDFQLGYALSGHKAQGSEWPRVIIALHDSNVTLLFNEWLYTSLTRARKRVDIVAQSHIIEKTVKNKRIKGSTLEAKIEFFNSGYLDQIVEILPTEEGE